MTPGEATKKKKASRIPIGEEKKLENSHLKFSKNWKIKIQPKNKQQYKNKLSTLEANEYNSEKILFKE